MAKRYNELTAGQKITAKNIALGQVIDRLSSLTIAREFEGKPSVIQDDLGPMDKAVLTPLAEAHRGAMLIWAVSNNQTLSSQVEQWVDQIVEATEYDVGSADPPTRVRID